MTTLTLLRPALLLLGIGLFAAGAQAQTTAMATAAPTSTASTPAAAPAERPMLVLPQDIVLDMRRPPAPEENAAFYDGSQKDLSKALAWIQEGNAISPTYWNLYTESCILLKMKDYAAARATAEKAYKLAIKAMPVSEEYVLLTAKVVATSHHLIAQQ